MRAATTGAGGRAPEASTSSGSLLETALEHLERSTVVVDCRWLGLGGAGRATEHLLDALRSEPPPGSWVFWGDPDRLERRMPEEARLAPVSGDPRRLFGQRAALSVPQGDVVLYMHQIRPLLAGCSVTLLHDTIPLRYGGNALLRRLKRRYYARVAAISARLLAPSSFSRDAIARDLSVRPDRIDVIDYPVDIARAARIAALRGGLAPESILLYVGRFDTHKNLERLCEAFARTAFAKADGRLLLVGGLGKEVVRLRCWITRKRIQRVEVRPACSDDELERLLAVSRALVAPSLEEGYGLPAFEAASAGLPVAASRTGAMTELPAESAVLFDPSSTDEMTRAIDEVTRRPVRPSATIAGGAFREPILTSLDRALGDREAAH